MNLDFLINSLFFGCIKLRLVYKIPRKYIRSAKKKAWNNGIRITCNDIAELYFDIEKKSKLFESKIRANKATVNLSLEDAKRIYAERKLPSSDYGKLIEFLIKTKKEDVKFTVDELIDLYRDDRNIKEITEALIKAKKEGIIASASDIKTLFYYKDENKLLLEYFVISQKEGLGLASNNLKVLFLKNIDITKALNVLRSLKMLKLQVPFPILVELLDEKVNVTKCMKILSKAKKVCKADMISLNIFDDKISETLSNIYVIEGKDKFKKELSDVIVNTNRMFNPDEIYYDLVASESEGFKLSFEMFKKYIGFNFKADIEEIAKAYLKARKNGLYVTFNQLARLAELGVDVHSFVNAQINSVKHV